jgi:glycerate kinase
LQALGVRLLDAHGGDLPRGGGALAALTHIDVSGLDPRWRDVELIIASDVENPAVGEHGAAAVFGPQKGASPEQVAQLDAALRHFFALTHAVLGVDVRGVRGAGAAGAFSGGLMAYLGGRIASGVDLVLAHNRFEALLPDAALVITGEGQMDSQTIHGKGPVGVARIARDHGVPTIAIVGGLNIDDAVLHAAGIHAALPITTRPMPLDEALRDAADLIERAALRLGYLIQLGAGRTSTSTNF